MFLRSICDFLVALWEIVKNKLIVRCFSPDEAAFSGEKAIATERTRLFLSELLKCQELISEIIEAGGCDRDKMAHLAIMVSVDGELFKLYLEQVRTAFVYKAACLLFRESREMAEMLDGILANDPGFRNFTITESPVTEH